ncbi:hypothetical protein [Lutibacter sp.]|uniref:hypothetical protein n=1 Tax=Lutibacter sp. TaxID=1925666 RepID=UPI0035616201
MLRITKVKLFIMLVICSLPVIFHGQTTNSQLGSAKQVNDKAILLWLKSLNQRGVEMVGDSVIVSEEFEKVFNDKKYRIEIYPKIYTWEKTVEFIKSQEIKIAFWYLINLYSLNNKNKETVIQSILMYDKLFKMDEILINTFYTYSFMDSEINILINGKPEIVHPDILEKKLANVKEIVNYIKIYNEKNKGSVASVKNNHKVLN